MKKLFIALTALMLLSITGVAQQVFFDDFEDGNANGWTVVEGSWGIISPGSGGSNYCYGTSDMIAVSYPTDFSAAFFILEVDFWIDNESSGNFDVEFNYQDENNYYMLDLADPESDDPNTRIYRYVNGVMTIIAETPNITQMPAWHHLKLVRDTNYDIVVYLNNDPVPHLSVNDGELTDDSEIRFRFYAGGKIDNVDLQGDEHWIEVTYPNGGEQWEIGVDTPTITWNHSGNFDTFDLWLSRDGGINWEFLDKGLYGFAIDWTWNEGVGGPPSNDCLVKVVGHYAGGETFDSSNNVFQIFGDHWIELTYPNGGEVWHIGIGDTTTIRWTHSWNFDSFDVLLSLDRGIVPTYDTLVTGLLPHAVDWCFNAPLQFPPSDSCVVKVVGYFGSDYVYDRSDDYFSIEENNDVDEITSLALPYEFALYPPYPNPFNPETVLTFDLSKAGQVSLIVYDIQGREVARLVDGFQPAGMYQRTFDGSELSSGVYFACLKAEGFSQTRKMLLIK
ncbi:T9SS type A sorting domain-containing protein [bacterium]|nr:T9SS type A sorting domain-containing protein [bacterium]